MAVPLCADELRKIYDAVLSLMTGERAVSVGFGERTVTCTQAQLKDLQQLYRTFYRECGSTSGLPDLANTVERGPPAEFRC